MCQRSKQGFIRVLNPSRPLPDGSCDPRHVYHVPHSLSHSLVSHFALPRPVIVIYFQYIILQISFNMSWAGTNCTSHVNCPVVPLHFLPEYQGPLSMFSVPYILPCHGHWPHNSGKIKYNRYTLQVHQLIFNCVAGVSSAVWWPEVLSAREGGCTVQRCVYFLEAYSSR